MTPTKPSQDEKAWLVERHFSDRIEYAYMDITGVHWTTDANKAMRLCRRDDAEMLACGCFDGDDIRIAEHLWPIPASKPSHDDAAEALLAFTEWMNHSSKGDDNLDKALAGHSSTIKAALSAQPPAQEIEGLDDLIKAVESAKYDAELDAYVLRDDKLKQKMIKVRAITLTADKDHEGQPLEARCPCQAPPQAEPDYSKPAHQVFMTYNQEGQGRLITKPVDVNVELLEALKDIEIRAKRIREVKAVVGIEATFIERVAKAAITKAESQLASQKTQEVGSKAVVDIEALKKETHEYLEAKMGDPKWWQQTTRNICSRIDILLGASAAIDHLASTGRIVREGFVAVPIKLTREMHIAGHDELEFSQSHDDDNETAISKVWKAMIEAAKKGTSDV